MAEWIWLSPEIYGEYQNTFVRMEAPEEEKAAYRYCVADFAAEIDLPGIPERVELWVSGDTHFRLWVNDAFVGFGPAAAGGDFLTVEPLDWYYRNPYCVRPGERRLRFFAQVQLSPQVLTEFSCGRGGFLLEGIAYFSDGTSAAFGTDAGWRARLNRSYCRPCVYDERLAPDEWTPAALTGDGRVLSDAPVKMLDVEEILPQSPEQCQMKIRQGEAYRIEYDKIYAACVGIVAEGACHLRICCFETPGVSSGTEEVCLTGPGAFRSFRMHSVGECVIEVLDASPGTEIRPLLYFSHYPVAEAGTLRTSDPELDSIYELCCWTLNICRQTIHLDSPMHQELLACTGDYYIETLMTLFTYGDLSLARGDVIRTAKWLVQNRGRMFHTTYSLIWVQMLELVIRYTGDFSLAEDCREALLKLFACFEGYLGENNLIDNPPDYMFVDWMVAEGYSLHHPPKYLGQAVLNAFYYRALCTAAELGGTLGWPETEDWRRQAAEFRPAFNRAFYDAERGLYIDGLPGDGPEPTKWQPSNQPRRHFSRYPNILAALYGLCDETEGVRLTRLMADDNTDLAPIQPYFMNFLLQAVERYGLYEELGMKLLKKWTPSVKACSKGLQEGWYKPEEGYSFDHSHAWGGCPAYFIPAMLTGLKVSGHGYRRITLSPKLYGLQFAEVTFPTPFGEIRCAMREGEPPQISVPKEIEWKIV